MLFEYMYISRMFFFFRVNITWNEAKEVLLAREILVIEPYQFKSKERGQSWQRVSDNLNKLDGFMTTSRNVRDCFKLLEGKFKKENE